MADCGCDKALAELEEFLHNELSDDEFRDVAEHLDACDACSHEHLVGLTLMRKVQSACQEVAPDDLRHAVLRELERRA